MPRYTNKKARRKSRAYHYLLPCTSLENMCRQCHSIYWPLRLKYPQYILSDFLPPNAYPLIFRGKFPLSEVGLDYAVRLAQSVETSLTQTLNMSIPVMGWSSFETHPHDDEELWVSILIQFPKYDRGIVSDVFRSMEGMSGFQSLVPRKGECPNSLFLKWHWDPMDGFEGQQGQGQGRMADAEVFVREDHDLTSTLEDSASARLDAVVYPRSETLAEGAEE